MPFVDFVPADFSDTGPGVVGELSIQRLLPRGTAGLSYTRETRTSSSLFASDVNVDTFALAYIHHLAPRVTFTLRGSYEHYESANDNALLLPAAYVPGSFNPITGPEFVCSSGSLIKTGQGINTTGQCQNTNRSALRSDSWSGVARIDWQLYRRLSTFATLRYQDRNGDVLLFGQNYDRFFVSIGFHYDYALGF